MRTVSTEENVEMVKDYFEEHPTASLGKAAEQLHFDPDSLEQLKEKVVPRPSNGMKDLEDMLDEMSNPGDDGGQSDGSPLTFPNNINIDRTFSAIYDIVDKTKTLFFD
jgi:hypothetical protein